MSLVPLRGEGWWVPQLPVGLVGNEQLTTVDTGLMDADAEEVQLVGALRTEDGLPHSFGLSSKVDWLTGAALTFAAGSTLRIGLKPSAAVDLAVGPPGRATLGTAAFAVYTDKIGGTDTMASTTWRSDVMTAGTPVTLTPRQLLAVCFRLATTGGTPSVRVRLPTLTTGRLWPACTLVTSGPTYTALTAFPGVILTCDDGALAWLDPTVPLAVADGSAVIGVNNILGNVVRLPVSVQIDALGTVVNPTTAVADFALEVYSTPLGTPVLEQSVMQDANVGAAISQLRTVTRDLPTPVTLAAETDYVIGVRQLTAASVAVFQRDVADATFFKALGLGPSCYAVQSTAGATFVPQNSSRRRYHVWMRVSALEVGASSVGGGLHLVGAGGLAG